MPSEEKLAERIRELEVENSELRDKLDMIYAIVAPEEDEGQDDSPGDLVQINGPN